MFVVVLSSDEAEIVSDDTLDFNNNDYNDISSEINAKNNHLS